MIERPQTSEGDEAETIAKIYLENLGLDWNMLAGKKVLDIGAMSAAFETAARRRGVDVVSIDKDVMGDGFAPPVDSKYVVANATQLPFRDGVFDYAIAHMSAMNYIEDSYDYDTEYDTYVKAVLLEACRVLKEGGQFLFTRTNFDEQEFRKGDEVVPEIGTGARGKWEADREEQYLEKYAKGAGFRVLRAVRYVGEHHDRAVENFTQRMTHFFVATK